MLRTARSACCLLGLSLLFGSTRGTADDRPLTPTPALETEPVDVMFCDISMNEEKMRRRVGPAAPAVSRRALMVSEMALTTC